MEQERLQEKTEKIQEERIREMEQVISLLEEENSLQKQAVTSNGLINFACKNYKPFFTRIKLGVRMS